MDSIHVNFPFPISFVHLPVLRVVFHCHSVLTFSQNFALDRSTSAGSGFSTMGTGMSNGRRVGPVITAGSEESRTDVTDTQVLLPLDFTRLKYFQFSYFSLLGSWNVVLSVI